MKKPVKVIQIDSMDGIVEMMKYAVAGTMTDWENNMLELDIPKREEYETEDEYQTEFRQYMVELVEEVKEAKAEVFKSVLDSYNDYLSSKYELESNAEKENEQCINMYINPERVHLKRVGMEDLLPFIVDIEEEQQKQLTKKDNQ